MSKNVVSEVSDKFTLVILPRKTSVNDVSGSKLPAKQYLEAREVNPCGKYNTLFFNLQLFKKYWSTVFKFFGK